MLGYAGASNELLAPTAENAHLLQQAADYRANVRLLAMSGKWDLFWGAICIALFALSYQMRFFSTLLLVLGVLFIGIGCWMVLKPNPTAMLADGFAFLVFTGINVWSYFHGRKNFLFERSDPGLLIAAITLLTAIARFRRYKRFVAVSSSPPSAETSKWLDECRRFLKYKSPDRSATMIRFDSTTFPPMTFKAELLEEVAVCLVNQSRLRIVPKSELKIEAGAAPAAKKIKVAVTLAEKSSKGVMRSELIERYRAWKGGEGEASRSVV